MHTCSNSALFRAFDVLQHAQSTSTNIGGPVSGWVAPVRPKATPRRRVDALAAPRKLSLVAAGKEKVLGASLVLRPLLIFWVVDIDHHLVHRALFLP